MVRLLQDRPALIVFGMLGTAAGLAIVLGHQRWTGGMLTVVVTVIGWVILIRGTVLLFLSQAATARLVEWFQFEEFFYLYLGFCGCPWALFGDSRVLRRRHTPRFAHS